MERDTSGDETGRPEKSDRPSHIVRVEPFADPEEIDRELEVASRRAQFIRNQRWENYRQYLVISWFSVVTIVLFLALVLSITVILTSSDDRNLETAKWILETLVGGFIAGLIGFWAVKSFEK